MRISGSATVVIGLSVAVAIALSAQAPSSRQTVITYARDVEIVGRDYAFVAPSELAAGQATFRFTNKGKVIHELDIALLKEGTTAEAVMTAVNAKLPLKPLIETPVGILIALAGHRSSVGLATELIVGRDYLVICRLQDSASAPMHS